MNIERIKESLPVYLNNLDVDIIEFFEKHNIECFIHACILHYVKKKNINELNGINTNINLESITSKINLIELIKDQGHHDYPEIIEKILLIHNEPSYLDNISILFRYYDLGRVSADLLYEKFEEVFLHGSMDNSNKIISLLQTFEIGLEVGIDKNEITDIKWVDSDFKYSNLLPLIQLHVNQLVYACSGNFSPYDKNIENKLSYIVSMKVKYNQNQDKPSVDKKNKRVSPIEIENWSCPMMGKKLDRLLQELRNCISSFKEGQYGDIPVMFNLAHQLFEYELGSHRELVGMRHLLHHLHLTRDGMVELFTNLVSNRNELTSLISRSLNSVNYFLNKYNIEEIIIDDNLILNIKKHIVKQGFLRTKTLEYVGNIDEIYSTLKEQNRIVKNRSSFFPMVYLNELKKIEKDLEILEEHLLNTDNEDEIKILEKRIKSLK